MKKIYCLTLLIFTSIYIHSQIEINDSDLKNLVEIGEYYSNNVMLTQKTAIEDLEKLRTNKLNNLINLLQKQSEKSIEVLDSKYLNRPNYDDLVMWYVIREIHYNLTDKENKPRKSIEVAKEFLNKEIDEKWLLDNYYHRLYGTVSMIFNKTDLSDYNIELDNYQLKSDTEKAIVFLNFMDALGTRFKVLQMFKNSKKILEFASRMPKFNGKEYFYYTNFEYEDFKWIGHRKKEMFNERRIGLLYDITMAHMGAESEINGKKETLEIYENSIMTKPEYFKYSNNKSFVKELYKKSK